MTRCVRRAFLCDKDKYSDNCYEHRRGMIVDRIKFLAGIFNIDVCAYAVMSNHYHLVLKINSTDTWREKQVLVYWSQLCQLPLICEKFMNGEDQGKAELEMVYLQTDIYRKRLMSISWFMKMLNEHIAKTANQEDKVTGSFFESRYMIYIHVNPTSCRMRHSNLILSNLVKSQALLDEKALLTCRFKSNSSINGSNFRRVRLHFYSR